ncbi:MAG: N-acetylmuramoyl-L-alanine amidase [bacterium]|nr:N-acetylmuramoyl-L-alanine amidase [bacterium]
MQVHDHQLVGDDGVPVPFRESPNWTHGTFLAPEYLLVHYTAAPSAEDAVARFLDPRARASAHLVVGRDGTVTQLVRFDRVAWHAGPSRWEGRPGLNAFAIGIELDNPGRLVRLGPGRWGTWYGDVLPDDDVVQAVHRDDPVGSLLSGWPRYPAAQLAAALAAAEAVVQAYGLRDVLGHDEVAPGRRSDPGPAFPMASVRARLFGRADDALPVWVTSEALAIRAAPARRAAPRQAARCRRGRRARRHAAPGELVEVLDAGGDQPDREGWVHSRFLRPAA